MKDWKDAHFVTLTIKAVYAKDLDRWMKSMNRGFQSIIIKYRKQAQRGKGPKLIGIKSLECDFNPMKRTYNPHFHLIVPNEAIAKIFIDEWILRCNRIKGKFYANRKGQNAKKIEGFENCMIEVIKYGTKIFTIPKTDEDKGIKVKLIIYVKVMHNILTAMKGIRLFDRFWFDLPNHEKESKINVLANYDQMNYSSTIFDWIDDDSELRLTEYALPTKLVEIWKSRIDTELE